MQNGNEADNAMEKDAMLTYFIIWANRKTTTTAITAFCYYSALHLKMSNRSCIWIRDTKYEAYLLKLQNDS